MEDDALYLQVKNDINIFTDSDEKKFILVEKVPGGGKTTFLLKTISYLFGEYTTSNKYQYYTLQDGSIQAVPAGSGNEAVESKEVFNLKTNNKTDIFYVNSDLRVGFVAFNSKIIKEISKKVFKIDLNVGSSKNAEPKNIIVKTSHGLLWSMAEKLNIFNNGVYTDYAKGSFTKQDTKLALNNILNLFENEKFIPFKNIKNDLQKLFANKSMAKLFNKIFYEFCLNYYETSYSLTSFFEYEKILEATQKKITNNESTIDIKNIVLSAFSKGSLCEIAHIMKKNHAEFEFMYKLFFLSMKELISKGDISVGHSYYYKRIYLECMKNKENLIRLFSKDNDTDKYLNVLFVDEAQDLTPIMINLLVEYFNYAQKNNMQVSIAMVGDSKQAIYGFSQRENAFKSIIKKVGNEKVKHIDQYYSFRLPENVCAFINGCSRDIYKSHVHGLEAATKKAGYVYNEHISLETFVLFGAKYGKKALILGRSNVEVTIAYIKASLYLAKQGQSDLLKTLRIDSKVKQTFEKVIKFGIDGIDDEALKERVKSIASKKTVHLKEMLDNGEIFQILPNYIKDLAQISAEYTREELNKVFDKRNSIKSNVSFMTAHTSKGLESDYVYMLDGIYDALYSEQNKKELQQKTSKDTSITDSIKNFLANYDSCDEQSEYKTEQEIEKFYPEEEEANIFYVAASRAEKALFLDKALFQRFGQNIKNIDTGMLEEDKILMSFDNTKISSKTVEQTESTIKYVQQKLL